MELKNYFVNYGIDETEIETKESLKELEKRLSREIKEYFVETGKVKADLVIRREGVRQCLGGGNA